MAKDDGVSSWVNFTHAMGNFHPRKPFLFSDAADALTTDGLWRQLGSKVLRVYALDFLYEVKMLVSRDNRAYTVVLHYGCVNCVPRLHALSRVGTKQFLH
jgi:hypothetical protein